MMIRKPLLEKKERIGKTISENEGEVCGLRLEEDRDRNDRKSCICIRNRSASELRKGCIV